MLRNKTEEEETKYAQLRSNILLTDIKTKCDQAKLYVFFVCYTDIKNITSRKTIIVYKCTVCPREKVNIY